MNVQNIKKSIKVARLMLPAYIKARFRPIPLWAHLVVTRKCNLDCAYCFARDPKKPDLNEEESRRVVDHLYSLGCRFISFFGGEPTIKEFFVDLVRYTNRKGIITHLSTNGILLTPRYISELGKAGIDVINLSIDSLFEFDAS
jgi:MoaA/NifB/PqqE/SkfB family radical SAM enzyme